MGIFDRYRSTVAKQDQPAESKTEYYTGTPLKPDFCEHLQLADGSTYHLLVALLDNHDRKPSLCIMSDGDYCSFNQMSPKAGLDDTYKTLKQRAVDNAIGALRETLDTKGGVLYSALRKPAHHVTNAGVVITNPCKETLDAVRNALITQALEIAKTESMPQADAHQRRAKGSLSGDIENALKNSGLRLVPSDPAAFKSKWGDAKAIDAFSAELSSVQQRANKRG